jgi:dCMP deaminase
VIGTAYNGLAPGFDAPAHFWDDREGRQKFMLHAEVNLCSLFKRGEAKVIATTTMPCTACMQTLCAYGVKEIYYRDVYKKSDAPEIAKIYGIKLEQVTDYPLQP